MAKKFIKRFMPDAHLIRNHKHLRMFGTALHNPNLWHLNRHSVTKAFAIGLFMAFMPMPFQMIPAAGLSILVHANLIIAVALVWVSNPVTMPPLFYFCYLVGTWFVGRGDNNFAFEASWQWLTTELSAVWQPFLLGCFVVASIVAIIGYFGVDWLWRLHVRKEWEQRRKDRAERDARH